MSLSQDLEPSPVENDADTALKNFFGLIGMNDNDSSSWSPSQSLSIPINIQTKDGPITYIITTAPDEESKSVPSNTTEEQNDIRNQLAESKSSENLLSTATLGEEDSALKDPVSREEGACEAELWSNLVRFDDISVEGKSSVNQSSSEKTPRSISNTSIPVEKANEQKSGNSSPVKIPKNLKTKKLCKTGKGYEPNPIPRRKIRKKVRKTKVGVKNSTKLESPIEENSEGSEGAEAVTQKSKHKKKRKIADWLAEGIDPTKLEENVDQVRMRFEKGCECPGENCFEGLSPEFVYKHRLNIAELTRAEHDMYLMGVTMATLSNPEATAKHTKRQRLRTSYVFLGREVCLDAWLYLENCTHYQLKRIRKHLITHGVSPRVHGNQGKKPHNTFPFRSYQLAFDFLNNWFMEYVKKLNKSNVAQGTETSKSRHPKHTPAPIYLPQDQTRKKLHQEYKSYFQNQALSHCHVADEEEDPDKYKVMGYSSFSQFLKVRFPHVKFAKVELNNAKVQQQISHKDLKDTLSKSGEHNDPRDDEIILDSTCTVQSIESINISSKSVAGEDHFVISIPVDPKLDNGVGTCRANIIYVDAITASKP